jgi:hypothetical protein
MAIRPFRRTANIQQMGLDSRYFKRAAAASSS